MGWSVTASMSENMPKVNISEDDIASFPWSPNNSLGQSGHGNQRYEAPGFVLAQVSQRLLDRGNLTDTAKKHGIGIFEQFIGDAQIS